MPELREHAPALPVDSARYFLPAGDLLVGIHSRCAKPSPTRNRNRSRFGDDKPPFRRALRLIFEHQISGDIAGLFGPRAREGRHHDAMPQCYGSDLYRREKLSS